MKKVPNVQTVVPLGALAVDFDPLEADVLLGQRGREEGDSLAQPAVQPLSGVIFRDGEFLHVPHLLSSLFLYCIIFLEKSEESI